MDRSSTTDTWRVVRGSELRADAASKHRRAVELNGSNIQAAEEDARSCLHLAASALNWLEDTDLEETAHAELDHYGRWARERFPAGCRLTWSGSQYGHACPVAVGHNRLGFSIGFTGNRCCSVCNFDISECPHLPGQTYKVEGGPGPDDLCRVCQQRGCGKHPAWREFETKAIVWVTSGTIHEVSIVAKPRQPDARLSAIPVRTDDLCDMLGPQFRPGMTVYCSRCLEPCQGLSRPFETSRHL